jgi:collagenase-like PrtC family protease
MTPVLDVPFLPEEGYVDFLQNCGQDIASVHFSLPTERRLDSRIRANGPDSLEKTLDLLAALGGVRRYGLLNSRFYGPELFTARKNLHPLIQTLERCAEKGMIDGIIYCDHYLLQLLSDEAAELAAGLEAVPGVNTMLDSHAKVEAQLDYISTTRFRMPGKVVLDRSLNRDLDLLAETALKCRSSFPDLRLELLANEGCLARCPFKLSHDAYIALGNAGERECTFFLNRELGCVRLVDEQPHRILQSPFIRPEDVDMYLFHVDGIKLCGRTLGSGFLTRVVTAYRERRYQGNLLDLLDALHWLAPSLFIDNGQLSFDFADMLSLCDSRCENCGFCPELFQVITRRLPPEIPDNRIAAN